MGKELREVIDIQEQQAAAQNRGRGNQSRLRYLQTLRSMINFGEQEGHIEAQLSVEAGIVIPQSPKKEQTPVVDLRKQTYEILSQMREPTPEEKTALEAHGQVFLLIQSKTYAQVVAEDPAHFWRDELNFANGRPVLKDYAMPIAAEVGLNPSELAEPGSFDQSQQVQLEMAEVRSKALQQEFPDARVIMLPVTGYAQADQAYKGKTGKLLFRNFFARGLDMLSEAGAANAGRDDPSERFHVGGWGAQGGYSLVALVPAVVFVGNQGLVS
ncbi:MAG: hypothetical protein UR81_C0024G0002 [Candidatus Levybacteria bacterium GW2011_GWB1_35_5]|nr:MAG: hypothetical protein UR81_C0024G0002 [Candidatus Levybacteria bacterium GW2011_GWB1_35_5]